MHHAFIHDAYEAEHNVEAKQSITFGVHRTKHIFLFHFLFSFSLSPFLYRLDDRNALSPCKTSRDSLFLLFEQVE